MNQNAIQTVLHIVNSLEAGGLERFVLDIIKATSNEYKYVIVCLDRHGELDTTGCTAEILSLDLQPGLHLNVMSRIKTIAEQRNVVLINTHNWKSQFYGMLTGKLCKIPVVHTKHGRYDEDLRSKIRNNLAYRLCDKVVAVSKDAALQCVQVEKVPETKLVTILNGIDTAAFSPEKQPEKSKTALGINSAIPVIGIVARLAQVKDHATLFAACQIIHKSGINFRLLVVGDGPLKQNLVDLAESLGISEIVVFAGFQQNIPDLMRAMDIFVLSSISEGISLTLIEAMACELPVVATAVGGNPEVVVEGLSGFLVPAKNHAAMAEQILQLLNNPELRQKFGKFGRQYAIDHFSISRAGKQYSLVYQTVLQCRKKR
jgi:sugar transferase (PEP-CTERM/EpsH1 system associated)